MQRFDYFSVLQTFNFRLWCANFYVVGWSSYVVGWFPDRPTRYVVGWSPYVVGWSPDRPITSTRRIRARETKVVRLQNGEVYENEIGKAT